MTTATANNDDDAGANFLSLGAWADYDCYLLWIMEIGLLVNLNLTFMTGGGEEMLGLGVLSRNMVQLSCSGRLESEELTAFR